MAWNGHIHPSDAIFASFMWSYIRVEPTHETCVAYIVFYLKTASNTLQPVAFIQLALNEE